MPRKIIGFSLLLMTLLVFAGCQGNKADDEEKPDENQTEDNENEKNEEQNETAYEAITTKNNEFGFHILDKLRDEEDGNHFISPVSLYMALSMVYPGADKETKAEMAALLDVEDMTVAELNEANAALLNQLNDRGEEDTALHLANSLWLNDMYQLDADYEAIIEKEFQGKLSTIDSKDDAAVDKMNEWVSEQTEGKIDQVIDAPLGDDFVAMLINAVYFNGKWTYPFDSEATQEGTFHLAEGKETEVPFMHLKEKLNYVKTDDYEAVRLPYGEDEKMGMYLYLPAETDNLAPIHKAFLDEGIDGMTSDMQQTEGTVSLPKFELEDEQEMNDVLKQLGMEQAFEKEKADFPNMIASDDRLHISEVKHMTYLDINEEGTEAAGSTNVGIDTMSMPTDEPFDLTFNHPFVLTIVDEDTGTILFVGDIYDVSP